MEAGAGAGARGGGGVRRREPAGGERPRSLPPNERDQTGTRGRGSRRVGRRRAVATALALGCGSCPAPRLVVRLADEKAWARLGPGSMGEVSDCLCPPHAGCPRHLSRREETLARLHADGLPYLISRRPPPNLASPPQQKGFPGPRNASRKRVDPWDPAVRARSPLAGSPPRAFGGLLGLLTCPLNVSVGTRREGQAQAPEGGTPSIGSSGPASYRWGEAESPAAEQQASQMHPLKPTLPTEHAQLTWNYKWLGKRKWTQGGRRWGSNGPHFFKTFPATTCGSFANKVSTLVLKNTQGRVGKAFQRKADKLV